MVRFLCAIRAATTVEQIPLRERAEPTTLDRGGERGSQVDRPASGTGLIDLSPAGEAVSEYQGVRGGITDLRQEYPFRTSERHLPMGTGHPEVTGQPAATRVEHLHCHPDPLHQPPVSLESEHRMLVAVGLHDGVHLTTIGAAEFRSEFRGTFASTPLVRCLRSSSIVEPISSLRGP